MNCCICGPVKNCAQYLDKVFENIEKIGAIFDKYVIIIYYDYSTDNTLQKLIQYRMKNPRLNFHVNKTCVSPYRTHRIAKARNYCLKKIREKYSHYPYFIMMDFDDVNCKNVYPEILRKYISGTNGDDWDGLSFNTSPKYYDIWGLSIKPFYFSYNHFNNNMKYYKIIQDFVTQLLNRLPPGKLLSCISSFNGFSIYKTPQFLNSYYDGRVRMDLVPKKHLYEAMVARNSPIIFKNYGNVDGKYEDCEHRAFHEIAIKMNHAKIRISPEVLFR